LTQHGDAEEELTSQLRQTRTGLGTLLTMRIVYGVHTQGQGGLSKAAVLIPIMESRGHEVRVITSGQRPPGCYQFRWHRHLTGMQYIVANGRTHYSKSFLSWLRNAPELLRSVWHVRDIVREFQPDVIVSDFEPLTASPLIAAKCDVVAVSRPVALLDAAVPLPDGMDFDRRLTRSTIRLFTIGATRRLGYHVEPASYRCLPPVVSPDVQGMKSVPGDHVLVYNVFHPDANRPDDLIAWANRNRQPVIAYGFPEVTQPGNHGLVKFRQPQRQQFLLDMAASRAVLTTAGFCLPLEAAQLGKPVCVVPIPGQWEQQVNAFHLKSAGLAHAAEYWNYDLLLDLPGPDAAHRMSGWLTTSPAAILDRILDEAQEPGIAKQPLSANRTAA
jgi:uncharacterized protein (TIGR00661 family)